MLHVEGPDGQTMCGQEIAAYPLHWDTTTVVACAAASSPLGCPSNVQRQGRPVSLYRTIVADPPWEVEAGRELPGLGRGFALTTEERSAAARKLPYPTLSVPEICALPVRDLADRDAHLYLWTINRYIEDAYSVARAWGFKPSTMLVWAKSTLGGGMGGAFGLST